MRTNNILTAILGTSTEAYTSPLFQWDTGIVLQINGVTLPSNYEVHFSNTPKAGEAVTSIGDADGVLIPDSVLQTGKDVYAFLYLRDEATDGWTVCRITIPVYARPEITDQTPEPSEATVIAQAIEALNQATEVVESTPKWNIAINDTDLTIEEVE